jgi:uncharacterized protein involved in tellurium resistance
MNILSVFQKCASEEIMKRILVMLLTGCSLSILGCAGAPVRTGESVSVSDKAIQVTGKYVNPMSSEIYIELKDDGTFNDKFGKRSTHGKYVVDGNRAIFTTESGFIFEFIVEGKSLVSKDGGRLTRQ